ncbi:MAG TPA: family 1 glycosylhydrolase [Terriglobales bacterium]
MFTRRDFLLASSAAAAATIAAGPARRDFPPDFLWGTASSAYQIEGAANEAGKGESVWDEFVRRPGVIADGSNGARACDFYHRYADDVALMRRLHQRAFRFSLAWTRIQPTGRGTVNQAGLDFYRRLCDCLLAAGIEPVATLFHWDTPLALERRGGWRNRDMAGWFADYTAIVAAALGDRVRWWLTVNEPRSFIGGGYVAGVQAPGLRLARRESLAAAHVVLLAHGRAVAALRAHAPRRLKVGIPNDFTPELPVTATDADTARRETFHSRIGHFTAARWWSENAWWHEPVYRGSYPEDAFAALAGDAPKLAPGDMATIGQPLDFIAANLYGGHRVGAGNFAPASGRTTMGWAITPEVMYWAPRWLHERYQLPVFVTENGCATGDSNHDGARVNFLRRHLQFLAHAAREGTPLFGYLHWSLLDNFEWQAGYTQRFGLVHVDFASLARSAKDSAHSYASFLPPSRPI